MRKRFAIIAALAMILVTLPLLASAGMGGGKLLKIGSPAPDFKFKDLAGQTDEFYLYAKGKPVILVFIQTACGSCQREMDFLKNMRASGSEIDVLVLFIDVKEMDFKGYVKDRALPFRFAWDSNFSIAEAYGVSFAPAAFLVDGDRNIVKVYRGWSRGGEEIASDVKALAGKK